MALFRIFNKRKNPTPTTSHQSTSQFPFSKDQVRVLLYKECDSKGRRLLFDSSAIQKVNLSNVAANRTSSNGTTSSSLSSTTTSTSITNGQSSTTQQTSQNGINSNTNNNNKPSIQKPTSLNGNFVETSNGYGYKYVRPENSADNDYNNIGEMIFGSVAMSFRGTSLKVHWLQSPKRLLYSQVFLEPIKSTSTLLDASTQAKMDVQSSMMVHTDSTSMNSLALSLSVLNLNGFGGGGGVGGGNVNGPKSICSCGGGGGAGGADKSHTNPLDVPFDTISDCGHTLAYSAGDSGYSGTDPWNVSCSSYCPYSSTRSSFCSVYSDRDSSRKLSIDSSINTDSCITTPSSDGNLQRRVLRNISTSFENRQSTSDFIGFISENLHQINTTNGSGSSNGGVTGGNGSSGGTGGVNGSGRSSTGTVGGGSDGCVTRAGRRCSEQVESRSNPEMFRKRGPGTHFSSFGPPSHRNGTSATTRRPKLGLAVCISLNEQVSHEMQLFCSEHISLLELMLCRLRSTAENAYINHKQFLKIMLHAWITTTAWLTDLFTAPRLSEPVWLTLSTGSSNNPSNLAHNFMSELCCLLSNADTKDTNFFISKLLTAILTHHLGWVGTIAPITIHNSNQSSSSSSSTVNAAGTDATTQSVSQFENEKLLEISKYHPYNVLWAQMGDLYGAIGNPPKISNTIICGNETNTIEKLLNVLTYFIRCGDIRREQRTELLEMDIINNIMETSKQNGDNNNNNSNSNNIRVQNNGKTGGLTRTMTHAKDLQSLITAGATIPVSESVEAINTDVIPQIEILKRNEIPNVLVYRNSRFVQQELRIGNFLMDTGIEMNTIQKLELKNYQKISSGEQIKLTVTNPDNEEFNVSSTDSINSNSNSNIMTTTTTATTTTTSSPIIDDVGEEALDYSERQQQELRIRRLQQSNINENINNQDDILPTSLSLSDLITANNLGLVTHCTGSGGGGGDNNVNEARNINGERKNSGIGPNGLFWNIETIKEGICLDQWQPIEKGIDIRNSTCMDNNCLSDGTIDTHSNTSFSDPQDQSELKRSKSLYTKSTNSKNENYRKLIKLTRKTSLTKNPEQSNLDNDEFEIIDIDSQQLKSHPSLSDLITANSVGVSERFTWGIEPVKESVCLEEEQHFELAKRMVEKEHDSMRTLPQQTSSTIVATASANAAIAAAHSAAASPPLSSSAVLFVLGDDEALINLKNTMQSSSTTTINENIKNSNNLQLNKLSLNNNSNNVNNNNNHNNNNQNNNKNKNKPKKQCTHKKQHSGLKFDFVQHTPIFENYMKKKNIELTNLTDKSLKLNNNSDYNTIHSSSNILFSKLPQNYNNHNNNNNINKIDNYQNLNRYSNQNIENNNNNNNLNDKNYIHGDRVNNNNHINIDDNIDNDNNINNNDNNNNGDHDGGEDDDDDDEEEECDYCATSTSISLQTPSNATELEFSTDDNSYPMFPSSTLSSQSSSTLTTKGQSSSTPSTILSPRQSNINTNNNRLNNQSTNQTHQQQLQSQQQQQQPKQNELNDNNKMINETMANKKIQLNQQEPSSNKQRNAIRFITLPMPKSISSKNNSQNENKTNINNNNNKDTKKLWDLEKRPGFIPSLFVGITDHYISDMVLQGTIAPSPTWEPILKQNLRLASHCAILAQSRTENIAIIANTDNWDVKVVSSQTYVLACGSGTSGSIGMSQLVASMLETVHAMWTAGTPANQCISFIESKLHEMYLLSETLAALLLATEFCSLNTVTTALNLSENDVPLLLSVASIHSPQVTKKYGISFR